MSVVQLHKSEPFEEISATLRRIADEIDGGEYCDWPITTAVIVFGHSSEKPSSDGDGHWSDCHWSTHGIGPRADLFTLRGLLTTVLSKGFDSRDGD